MYTYIKMKSKKIEKTSTTYVILFKSGIEVEVMKWFYDKVDNDKNYKNLLKLEPCYAESMVLVTASKDELLVINSITNTAVIQDHYLQNNARYLTLSEEEYCLRYALMNICVSNNEVITSTDITISSGDSIVSVLEEKEVIYDIFPLHNTEELEKVKKNWYWNFSLFTLGVPNEVHGYFGEAVAMYFKFIGFYTMMLIIPTILGVLTVIYSFETPMKITFFAVFNLVWATFFLEFWKRKCAVLSFNWGTLTCSIEHEVQPHYCGKGRHNVIINRYKQDYPLWKVRLKVFLSSLVIVIGSIFAMWLAVYEEEIIRNIPFSVTEDLGNPLLECTKVLQNGTIIFFSQIEIDFTLFLQYFSVIIDYYLYMKIWLLNSIHFSKIILYLYSTFELVKEFFFEHFFDFKTSTAIYATFVWILNHLYTILAFKLTKWENHRLQGDFDWHHISKIVILEFINNFSSLFYIAFYLQDMERLRSQVSTMLIIKQIINQFEETIFPYICKKIQHWLCKILKNNNKKKEKHYVESKKSSIILQSEKEADLENIEDAVEDYLEMFMQFGYVCLFSSAFPLAAFWAFLNNMIELKSDAFKFCNLYKRPRVKRVRSIGVWQGAFELLGVVGVATNCALLCMSPSLQSYATNWNPVHWVLLFVAVEHITLGVKAAVMYIVDDQPRWVKEKLEESNCKSRHNNRERILEKAALKFSWINAMK